MLSRLAFSLTQLEYVMAVHKHGHFAKAAEACHVTQPTLSMQIQKLEGDLGVTIFDRSKKPVLLTDAGKKLITQMQAVLFEAKKIETILQSSQGEVARGELVLGVIPTIAPYLLPRLLPILESEYPSLSLQITEMETSKIVEALENDELDVGILATPLHLPQIYEHALYYEPFSVLCRKGDELCKLKRVKSGVLRTEQMWLLTEGHCLRNQVLDVCAHKNEKGFRRKFKFESGSLETLKNLVDAYGGYTLLPQLAAEKYGDNSQLVPFERPIPAREIGLVFRRQHYKADLIEALGEAILASIPEEVRKIRPKDFDVIPVEE